MNTNITVKPDDKCHLTLKGEVDGMSLYALDFKPYHGLLSPENGLFTLVHYTTSMFNPGSMEAAKALKVGDAVELFVDDQDWLIQESGYLEVLGVQPGYRELFMIVDSAEDPFGHGMVVGVKSV